MLNARHWLKRAALTPIALGILFTQVPSAAADPPNLLENGGFEIGPAIPGGQSFLSLPGGSTAIAGWTVIGSEIDYIGPGWAVSEGTRCIDLDGSFATGGIAQTFIATPGQVYTATFDLSGNPEGPPLIKQVRVEIDGVSQVFDFNTTGQTRSSLIWLPQSIVFTASQEQVELSFLSLSSGGNSWGALIDRVSVEVVSECTWDLDFDGNVGINDLLELLANWGSPYGIVDFLDLLGAWGPCP